MERRRKYLVPAFIILLMLVVMGGYFVHVEAQRVEQQQALVKSEIQDHASLLAHHLEQAFAATEVLAVIIRQHNDIRDFDTVASSILTSYRNGSISTLQLAPNAVVERIFPRVGNETAVGHDLLADPARRDDVLEAIRTKKLVVSGPVNLIQGGEAIIGRLPVFVANGRGEDRFWGLAIAVVRVPNLLQASHLDQFSANGFDYIVSYAAGGGKETLIHRSRANVELVAPITQKIVLANGVALSLSVGVQPGRMTASPLAGEIILLVLASIALGAFIYQLLRRREILERLVRSRTQSLRDANCQLESEVAEKVTAQEALRQSNRFLDSVVDNIPNMVFVKDANELKFVRVNKAGEALTGLSREELYGKCDYDLFPQNEADFFIAKDRETLAAGRMLNVPEEEIVTRSLGKRYLHTKKIPILDEHGKPEYLLGISEDITEQKLAREKLYESEELFRTITENAGDLIAMLDTNGRRIYNNPAYRQVFGDHLAKANLDSFAEIHPEDRERIMAIFDRTVATGVGERAEYRFLLPGGEIRYIESEGSVIRDANEKISKVVVVSRDITERRAADEKLRLAARVFENSGEGIIVTDAASNILMVNRAFTTATRYAADEVIGKNPRILSSGEQEPQFYHNMWKSVNETGEWHGEVLNRRKTGEIYTQWLTLAAVYNHAGVVTNYVGTFIDLTARKQTEERLHFLAFYDALTELPNRVLLVDRLDRALMQAKHTGDRVAVMFLDVDRFSVVNETLGHTCGDLLLKEVSKRLRDCVRPHDSVARVGGDEFTIVVSGAGHPDEVNKIAQDILLAMARPFLLQTNEVFVSASIGISLFPDDGDSSAVLLKNADSAMHRAVELGGNNFRFYTLDMNAKSYERMLLGIDLRHAIERGELQVHYQPLVDIGSGKIVGAEALLRWWRQDFGMVPPAAFVPLLEETGLIIPVSEWVLKTACIQCKCWLESGFPDMFVAVNFSAQQFERPGVVADVGRLIAEAGLDPHHLEIELTEGILMSHAEETIKALRGLKASGIKLSVDDFGTGYSSLSYLKRFPLDTLKIDRSFVSDLPDEPDAVAIVNAIVAMGHSLNLKIIAEGVENREQIDFLREIGCEMMQGYYLGRALQQDDFLRLLQQGIGPERPSPKLPLRREADANDRSR